MLTAIKLDFKIKLKWLYFTGVGGPCWVGYFCSGGTETPEPCPAGSFANESGLAVCHGCPEGYYCIEGKNHSLHMWSVLLAKQHLLLNTERHVKYPIYKAQTWVIEMCFRKQKVLTQYKRYKCMCLGSCIISRYCMARKNVDRSGRPELSFLAN